MESQTLADIKRFRSQRIYNLRGDSTHTNTPDIPDNANIVGKTFKSPLHYSNDISKESSNESLSYLSRLEVKHTSDCT